MLESFFERVELSDAEGNLTVAVGSEIAAVVAGVDKGTGQVRLSPVFVRAPSEGAGGQQGDRERTGAGAVQPKGGPLLVEGARVRGKVTGIERYGVFVQIDGTSGRSGRGLVPTPETGTPRGADLKKIFVVGQDIDTKILNIDETGKIRLSITALKADEERSAYEAFVAGTGVGAGVVGEGEAAAPAESGAKGARKGPRGPKKQEPRNFGTLGDLLKREPRR